MNSVFIVVRLNEDDSIAELISAHPTKRLADAAERFYRNYTAATKDNLRTDVQEIGFEVQ